MGRTISETYRATPARVGNSQGFRMDADLFQQHPELRTGAYEVAYIGQGTVLLRPRVDSEPDAGGGSHDALDADPVVGAYLAWAEQVMIREPNRLRTMTVREFEIAEALVDGIEVDLEMDRLPDGFELP